MLCVFNLSAEQRDVTVSGLGKDIALEPVSSQAVLSGKTLNLGPNGYAFMALDASNKARVAYSG